MEKLIKEPLITEKNTILNAMGVYVFKVSSCCSKIDVKKAVQQQFNVKVKSVRTSNCRGRSKSNKFGKGAVSHWKKAMVKLQAGEKIALFEGV